METCSVLLEKWVNEIRKDSAQKAASSHIACENAAE